MTKRLAELMAGVLGVDSAVGQGSVFWCEFNVTAPPELALQIDEIEPSVLPAVPGVLGRAWGYDRGVHSMVPLADKPTAKDECDPNPTVTLNESSTQNPDPAICGHYTYTITRIWTATDACGNQSSRT